MPKFYSLERPPQEKAEKLTEELHEYPELRPRLTFAFPLNESRRNALEMLRTDKFDKEKIMALLKSDDFIERDAGVFLVKIIPKTSEENREKALPALEEMSRDNNGFIRAVAIRALGNLGEKALPILDEILKNTPSFPRENQMILGAIIEARKEIAVEARGEKKLPERVLPEKALPIEEGLLALEEMSRNIVPNVREKAVRALGNLGEKALPILEERSRDREWFVRGTTARILGNLGEKALPILEKMSADENKYVGKAAALAMFKIKKGYKWLLSTRKPLFATPFTKDLADRILKIQEIAEKLKKKFKDDFIGITVLGSTAKGYFTAISDLDWGIIAKNKEVFEELKRLAAPLKSCLERYAGLNEKYQIQENERILFYGLFFGDHDKLLEIQKTFLENINQERWDGIRRIIFESETGSEKGKERFGLEEESEKIEQAAALLRVPPSYQETLEIVRKRAKKKS